MEVIKKLSEASDIEELEEIFFKAIAELGITNYAYVLKDNPNWSDSEPFYISNYSDQWAEHYLESKYQKIDPVLQTLDEAITPFRWSDVSQTKTLTIKQKQFFNEAHDFGLSSGLGVPVFSPGMGNAIVSLVSDLPDRETNALYQEQIYKISLYSVYFHYAALYLSGRIMVRRFNPSYQLTAREKDIIHWAAENKTYPEIAIILGISYNTVLFHAKNIYQKMRVYSRQEMVVKAIMNGLVDTR